MSKKYSEMTKEEKEVYNQKVKSAELKKVQEREKLFEDLIAELKTFKVSDSVLQKVEILRKGKIEKSSRLERLFGTSEVKEGMKVTFLYIGVRGLNGERTAPDAISLKEYVTKWSDVKYVMSSKDIKEDVWYLKKSGHDIEINEKDAYLVYKGKC